MMRKHLTVIKIILLSGIFCKAQDTLPSFSATTRGNGKILISWTNNYPLLKQISIQRSADSTKGFRTIMTVPDAMVKQNGYVDSKAPTPDMFYRLFIVMDSGQYIFAPSRKAVMDTSTLVVERPAGSATEQRVQINENLSPAEAEKLKEQIKEKEKAPPAPEKFFYVKRHDSIIAMVPEKNYKRFRDSVVTRTKDTLAFNSLDTITIKPFIPRPVFKPSRYVYTGNDGNISIRLPDAEHKKYSLKFYDEEDQPLFELSDVKESQVVLDKVNFLHAGWFHFELYEDGKLKEKHKFFIAKDF